MATGTGRYTRGHIAAAVQCLTLLNQIRIGLTNNHFLAVEVGSQILQILIGHGVEQARHFRNGTIPGFDVNQLVVQIFLAQTGQFRIHSHYRLGSALTMTARTHCCVLFTRCRISCPVSHRCKANSENNSCDQSFHARSASLIFAS